jgi:hypothetical protein
MLGAFLLGEEMLERLLMRDFLKTADLLSDVQKLGEDCALAAG